VSDVEIESEYQLSGGCWAAGPNNWRSLAAWLLEQEAEEVVMESTAQYWKTSCGERWKGIEAVTREARKAQGGGPERCIWLKRNRTAGPRGRKKIFLMPNAW